MTAFCHTKNLVKNSRISTLEVYVRPQHHRFDFGVIEVVVGKGSNSYRNNRSYEETKAILQFEATVPVDLQVFTTGRVFALYTLNDSIGLQ